MSVAASAKAHLVGESGVLAALLPGVVVSYSLPTDPPRELVYGGNVTGTVAPSAMKGGVRLKREENLTLVLYVRVATKGRKTSEQAEVRAVAIGDVIANYIAEYTTLADLTDLKLASVSAVDLDGWVDDDGAGAILTLTVGLMSYLT